MARRQQQNIRRSSITFLHKIKAFVALLSFCVVLISGWQARVSLITILLRATIVIGIICLIAVVVIRALAAYEEMNSGEG